MTKQAYFTKIRRFILKREAVKLLGGKCKKCQWSGSLAGFHFHHRNPKEKSFLVGNTTNWERFWKEVQKCDLLCSICHDILHCDYENNQFLEDVEKYKGRDLIESKTPWKNQTHIPRSPIRICKKCGNKFVTPFKIQKFCSTKCYNLSSRKVRWPSKKRLLELTKTLPMTKIGKMFGVSDNAVRKWCKYYKI
jgi:uncharacterized OB-fold protein